MIDDPDSRAAKSNGPQPQKTLRPPPLGIGRIDSVEKHERSTEYDKIQSMKRTYLLFL